MRRLGCVGCVLMIALAASQVASAQSATKAGASLDTATEKQKADASAAFKTGKLALDNGRTDSALEKFRESYAIVASPNAHLMIARMLAAQNKPLEAHREAMATAAEAAAVAAKNPKYQQAADDARALAAEQERFIALVTVQIELAAGDETLTVGGLPIAPGRAGNPIAVAPGKVEVVLTNSFGEARQTVDAPAGSKPVVKLVAPRKLAAAGTGWGGDTANAPDLPKPTDGADAPAPKAADDEPTGPDRGAAVVAGKVGGFIPLNGFGKHVTGALEVGYIMPWLKRAFSITVSVGYAQPTAEGVGENAQVARGVYLWRITQRQLTLQPSISYRATMIPKAGPGRFVPYLGAGPRIHFIENRVTGELHGADIPETKQASIEVGVGGHLGLEYVIGPGGVLVEGLFGWAKTAQTVTGESHLSAVSVWTGYRFML
jgi:hypothetical protein